MYEPSIVLGTLYPKVPFNLANIKRKKNECKSLKLIMIHSDGTLETVEINDKHILKCQTICTDYPTMIVKIENPALSLYVVDRDTVKEAITILSALCKGNDISMDLNPSSYAIALCIVLQTGIDAFEHLSDIMRSFGYKYYPIHQYIGIPYCHYTRMPILLNHITTIVPLNELEPIAQIVAKSKGSSPTLHDLDGEFIVCRQERIKVFYQDEQNRTAQILAKTGNITKHTYGPNVKLKGSTYRYLTLWTCEDWLKRTSDEEYLAKMINNLGIV